MITALCAAFMLFNLLMNAASKYDIPLRFQLKGVIPNGALILI